MLASRTACACLAGFFCVPGIYFGGRWSIDKYGLPAPAAAYRAGLPEALFADGNFLLRVPGQRLVGDVAVYEDELSAYLMFDFLRTRRELRGTEILITHAVEDGAIRYPIRFVPEDNLPEGMAQLYALPVSFPFLKPSAQLVDERVVRAWRLQSETFQLAYRNPGYREPKALSRAEVVAYTRRFIRFKSSTDPRIVRRLDPAPSPLSEPEAEGLAEDIVSVARFYDLPLEFFLGIGAMENNYMNVKGDIGNTIWKRSPGKGDVVLRRQRGRVLVLNESSGVWQITRETLRYVHRLYLKDTRDYRVLPEALRPPRKLDVTQLDLRVLTTYAGLLFRDLLDQFDGDMVMAVGAYNGGVKKPNLKYQEGVRLVAEYARRMMEQSAALRGRRVVDFQFMRSGR